MPSSVHLAFDLGAESGRAVVGELEAGRLRAREIARFPNGILEVRGRSCWNVLRLYENLIAALGQCAREGISPDTIGVDTWGVDFALLDSGGGVSGLPFSYRDRQTEGAPESFFAKMSPLRLYERTGIQILAINSVFQLEAMLRDDASRLRRAADLLFMPDLFHYLLGGVKKTEFTLATTSQLYNPETMAWDPEITAALGLPEHLLQEVVPPGTVLAPLSENVAELTGVSRAKIIAVATHDTASAVAAIPVEDADFAYLSSGTWSLLGVESPRPIITPASFAANVTNEGGVGGTFRVLRNISGLWLAQECRRAWARCEDGSPGGASPERSEPESSSPDAWTSGIGSRPDADADDGGATPNRSAVVSYDELEEAARAAPAFAALCDPDHPDFVRPTSMPDAMKAYFRRTGQPVPATHGALIRSILESLALKCRFVLDLLRGLGPRDIRRLHVIGGGAQNKLLCQFAADATGLPVVAGPAEASAIGNLLVQAMATGRPGSLEELRAIVARSFTTITYLPGNRAGWDAAYSRFLDLGPR